MLPWLAIQTHPTPPYTSAATKGYSTPWPPHGIPTRLPQKCADTRQPTRHASGCQGKVRSNLFSCKKEKKGTIIVHALFLERGIDTTKAWLQAVLHYHHGPRTSCPTSMHHQRTSNPCIRPTTASPRHRSERATSPPPQRRPLPISILSSTKSSTLVDRYINQTRSWPRRTQASPILPALLELAKGLRVSCRVVAIRSILQSDSSVFTPSTRSSSGQKCIACQDRSSVCKFFWPVSKVYESRRALESSRYRFWPLGFQFAGSDI